MGKKGGNVFIGRAGNLFVAQKRREDLVLGIIKSLIKLWLASKR